MSGYRTSLVFAGLIALLVGVGLWVGVAGAAPPAGHGNVPIQSTLNCGTDTGDPMVGKVRYSWDGTTLTIDISLHGAAPNNTYQFVFEFTTDNGATCGSSGFFATVTTNAQGVGHGSGSEPVNCFGSGAGAFLVSSSTAPAGEGVTSLMWTLPNIC